MGSLLIKRVTLPLRLANLHRFSFFSTLHSYARRNHDVIVADAATSAIVYRPSVVAKFRKMAKADGALLFSIFTFLWRRRIRRMVIMERMEAPRCIVCKTRHWSRQPCPATWTE
jgi:hypothetical protein